MPHILSFGTLRLPPEWRTTVTTTESKKYALEKPIEETVLYDKTTHDIVTITLNRPEKHNAIFPPDQFNEISRKIAMAVDDDDVKVIILKGNGKSFCSGDAAPCAGVGSTECPEGGL